LSLSLTLPFFSQAQDESIANNPYYFTGAFSTVVVVPAAYNFVINVRKILARSISLDSTYWLLQLMSNHSKEVPSGYLDPYNFRTFFGVEEGPDGLKWLPGQERVPENWVKTVTPLISRAS
jgi:hypothetical protein